MAESVSAAREDPHLMTSLLSMRLLAGNRGLLDGASTRLTVCARDRHGLFADLAGTLAAQGIEILAAEVNTRDDGIAIDVFALRAAATG